MFFFEIVTKPFFLSCQLVDICILFNLTIDHHLRSLRFCDFLVVSHSPDQLLICSQYEEWNFFVFGENSKHKIGTVKNECTTFQQHFFYPPIKMYVRKPDIMCFQSFNLVSQWIVQLLFLSVWDSSVNHIWS